MIFAKDRSAAKILLINWEKVFFCAAKITFWLRRAHTRLKIIRETKLSRTRFYLSENNIHIQQYRDSYFELLETFKSGAFSVHHLQDIAKILFFFKTFPTKLNEHKIIDLVSSRVELMNSLNLIPRDINNLINDYVYKELLITGEQPDLDTKFNQQLQRLEVSEEVESTSTGEGSDDDGNSSSGSSCCDLLGCQDHIN